jgi:hypothetical protein
MQCVGLLDVKALNPEEEEEMDEQELLDSAADLSKDLMTLATERSGAISGVLAEYSQRFLRLARGTGNTIAKSRRS